MKSLQESLLLSSLSVVVTIVATVTSYIIIDHNLMVSLFLLVIFFATFMFTLMVYLKPKKKNRQHQHRHHRTNAMDGPSDTRGLDLASPSFLANIHKSINGKHKNVANSQNALSPLVVHQLAMIRLGLLAGPTVDNGRRAAVAGRDHYHRPLFGRSTRASS